VPDDTRDVWPGFTDRADQTQRHYSPAINRYR